MNLNLVEANIVKTFYSKLLLTTYSLDYFILKVFPNLNIGLALKSHMHSRSIEQGSSVIITFNEIHLWGEFDGNYAGSLQEREGRSPALFYYNYSCCPCPNIFIRCGVYLDQRFCYWRALNIDIIALFLPSSVSLFYLIIAVPML